MAERAAMARLADLAQMLSDAQMVRLRKSAEAREEAERALARLDSLADPPADSGAFMGASMEQAGFRFQLWADRRRAEVNTLLARRKAQYLQDRDGAARAFGRAMAVSRLLGEKPAGRQAGDQ
ncbi:MAG: hypothetical protein R3D84_00530 [Paracoccaceae bacterium]